MHVHTDSHTVQFLPATAVRHNPLSLVLLQQPPNSPSSVLRRSCWRLLQADIQAFRKRERPPKKAARVDCSQHHADAVPDFLNGRVLRDYQTTSLQWMMQNFRQNRSCILGDEMVCLSRPARLKRSCMRTYVCMRTRCVPLCVLPLQPCNLRIA